MQWPVQETSPGGFELADVKAGRRRTGPADPCVLALHEVLLKSLQFNFSAAAEKEWRAEPSQNRAKQPCRHGGLRIG